MATCKVMGCENNRHGGTDFCHDHQGINPDGYRVIGEDEQDTEEAETLLEEAVKNKQGETTEPPQQDSDAEEKGSPVSVRSGREDVDESETGQDFHNASEDEAWQWTLSRGKRENMEGRLRDCKRIFRQVFGREPKKRGDMAVVNTLFINSD